MTARADLERAIDIANATHIDRGYGWEPITHRGHCDVHVMPHFGIHRVRVPYAAINEWASLETIREEDDDGEG